jgi:hypothetical protein
MARRPCHAAKWGGGVPDLQTSAQLHKTPHLFHLSTLPYNICEPDIEIALQAFSRTQKSLFKTAIDTTVRRYHAEHQGEDKEEAVHARQEPYATCFARICQVLTTIKANLDEVDDENDVDDETAGHLQREIDKAEADGHSEGKPGSFLNKLISHGNKKTEEQMTREQALSKENK